MKYTNAKKNEWLRTTTNYLISTAYEMKHFLPWAESFQSHFVGEHHVAVLAECGVCSDIEPQKLSRDLQGYLNSCLHGDEKIDFNNIDPGNGIDAGRRIVVPVGPRSEAQLNRMHKDEHNQDLNKWEGSLTQY